MTLPCLKADPKSLGIVQVVLGAVMFSFGFITTDLGNDLMSVRFKVMYWGSACFIVSGVLSFVRVFRRHPCLVKSWLVVTVISGAAAVANGILFFLDLKQSQVSCDNFSKGDCRNLIEVELLRGIFRLILGLSAVELLLSILTVVLILGGSLEDEF